MTSPGDCNIACFGAILINIINYYYLLLLLLLYAVLTGAVHAVLTGAVHAGEHQTPAPQTVLAGGHVACNVASFGTMLINVINYYYLLLLLLLSQFYQGQFTQHRDNSGQFSGSA